MLSDNLERSIRRAFECALNFQHEFVTLEHLLYALLHDPDAITIFDAYQVNIEYLCQELFSFIKNELKILVTVQNISPQPTRAFQRVIQNASFQITSDVNSNINAAHVLAALFSEKESHAVYFLQRQNLSKLDILDYITQNITKKSDSSSSSKPSSINNDNAILEDVNENINSLFSFEQKDNFESKENNPLDIYCVNLNEKARQKLIDPLVGRNYYRRFSFKHHE